MTNTWGFQIWALARHVWIEALRDRVIQVLCVIGLTLQAFSIVLSRMAIGSHARVIQDMGFWVLWISGLLGVLYLGSNLVRMEIQNRTVYLILSRPVSRSSFLLGKFCGMILVLGTNYFILGLSFIGIMLLSGIQVSGQHILAMFFIFVEWVVLAAFSIFFAGFTSPLLHNFFLTGVAFLGHWCNDLRLFAKNTESQVVKGILNALYFVLPNLESINFKEAALYGDPVPNALLFGGVLFAAAWTGTLLFAAATIFSGRKIF